MVLDARDKPRLEALGIRDFDVVVVSLGERVDASALVTLHLKELGVKRLITKAGSEDHGKLLELIGVSEVVFPEREAAARLAHRLTSPNVIDYIPWAKAAASTRSPHPTPSWAAASPSSSCATGSAPRCWRCATP